MVVLKYLWCSAFNKKALNNFNIVSMRYTLQKFQIYYQRKFYKEYYVLAKILFQSIISKINCVFRLQRILHVYVNLQSSNPSIITVIHLYLSIYLPSELAGNYIFIYYFSDKVAPHQRNTCQCAIPFFSYKNRYNSLFPVIPPLPPGFLLVVLGFRHASISLRSQRGPSRQVHVSVSSVQCLVPFCFRAQCPVSRFQPRFAFEHQYFLSPLRLSVRRLVYRACLNMSFWFFIGSIALFGWSAY
ncbi:hypothetical protein F4703DRAFT_1955898 [Phycomyces blakesleeanus]